MDELIINLHMHTFYSDGHADHRQIAQAALEAGLDAVLVTDHNVLVNGPADYYRDGNRRTLLIVGEEVHDPIRDPQKNHLLVFGVDRELSPQAENPQNLIEQVSSAGGICFLAHPVDPAAPAVDEAGFSWVDWQIHGYTGIELWNAMSEFKGRLKTKGHAIYYAFNPKNIARGPFPDALKKWDELLVQGKRVVAIGGSDAHAIPGRMGPIHRTLFPYRFHFTCVNTHLLPAAALKGEVESDTELIIETLRRGRAFIGYDLPASTRGFRFSAHGRDQNTCMGEEVSAKEGVTFQIHLPRRTECRLIKDGKLVKSWFKHEICTYITTEPGAYRVEVYIRYRSRRRTWIISNPIYVVR